MTLSIMLPCYNEATTIAKVVGDFRRELPDARIYVYDNNSTDGSVQLAMEAGATVRHVPKQGKGYVVRKMFQDIQSDIYVLCDSDDTYPADEVKKLIAPVVQGMADMVVGDRLSSTYIKENKRAWHGIGNFLVRWLINKLWRVKVMDVMSGYRVFSRRFVKTCPILSTGFELETEMTLHALDKRMNVVELPIVYRDRPQGSVSKLNTFRDGFKVIMTIFNLFRQYRPLAFFGWIGAVLGCVAVVLAFPVFVGYFETGVVPRFPTLIFSCFLLTASLLSICVGLVLDAVKRQSDQMFELEYTQCGKDANEEIP